jgi:hypothetical protein
MNKSNQKIFDDIIDLYNQGLEPLENWATADLVRLQLAVDVELQSRAPQVYDDNEFVDG